MQKEATRIGNGMVIVLLGAAAFFDLLSLIPFVGNFTGPVLWAGVAFYLWRKGYGLLNPKRLITAVISFVAEQIPAVQFLPALMLGVAVIIALTRIQNKTGISVTKIAGGLNKGGVRAPSLANARPLNSDGVRMPVGVTDIVEEE